MKIYSIAKLKDILDFVDQCGKFLLGDLWRTFYLTLQDAIALSLLLKIPDAIASIIIGHEFSDFNVCLTYNETNPTRYACFIIVSSNFLLWIVLAGRILVRFLISLAELVMTRGGTKNASKKP
ncbi:MAG: hypothetical protein HC836_45685 [Richelia sp. RM2_1_2]|nr:hypothetical protein [Richelia sp. RM2_1_2]